MTIYTSVYIKTNYIYFVLHWSWKTVIEAFSGIFSLLSRLKLMNMSVLRELFMMLPLSPWWCTFTVFILVTFPHWLQWSFSAYIPIPISLPQTKKPKILFSIPTSYQDFLESHLPEDRTCYLDCCRWLWTTHSSRRCTNRHKPNTVPQKAVKKRLNRNKKFRLLLSLGLCATQYILIVF